MNSTSDALLETQNLNKTFGAVTAADDINVTVTHGEIVGIIGANGAGKTTFVNMVTGYLKPTSGKIFLRGNNITNLKPRQITRLGMSRSFQVPQVFLTQTVFENLIEAAGIADHLAGGSMLKPLYRPALIETTDRILHRYHLNDYRDQETSTLPQGIRKLLDIAMAMVSNPSVLLLDEPTSGISVEEKFGLMDVAMQALKEADVTVLFIEHDMEIIERYVSRVLAFYEGRIIADKPPELALKDPDVRQYVIGDFDESTDAPAPDYPDPGFEMPGIRNPDGRSDHA